MLFRDFCVKQKAFIFFIISLVIFIVDQLTKMCIKNSILPLETIYVTSFLNLVYVENVGSAFGMFKSLGNKFFISVSIIAIIVISILIIKDSINRLAYALLLGGALGNMTDRILYGYVIDFFDFHLGGYHWYAFNVADASLTIGMILMLINAFLPYKSNQKQM